MHERKEMDVHRTFSNDIELAFFYFVADRISVVCSNQDKTRQFNERQFFFLFLVVFGLCSVLFWFFLAVAITLFCFFVLLSMLAI